eukprot:6220949-Prymnesium_polylepis.1
MICDRADAVRAERPSSPEPSKQYFKYGIGVLSPDPVTTPGRPLPGGWVRGAPDHTAPSRRGVRTPKNWGRRTFPE